MIFSSIEFIGIFLPILLLVYTFAEKRLKNFVLLIGSLIFYSWGGGFYGLFLLWLTLVVNFLLDRLAMRFLQHQKLIFSLMLLWNLGFLFFFKYFEAASGLIERMMKTTSLFPFSLPLPLGISFYTFQMVSYQIDTYKGIQKRCSSFSEFALYVCMFPKLISGPIVRFRELENPLKKPEFCLENIESGLKIFTIGLSMKVLLADKISTLFFAIEQIGVQNLHVTLAWLGSVACSFQIYFDFFGYSLMAIGTGQLFGYLLPENFNHPYSAKSVTEFWRKWHITLSKWFRDYLYIPLGGNRKGRFRTYCNLLIVWLFTGLWHGASVNFILWGLFFFVLLVLEKAGLGAFLEKTKVLGHLYLIVVIPISWIIFSQTDFSMLLAYLAAMFGGNGADAMAGIAQLLRLLKEYAVLLLICVICSTPFPMRILKQYEKSKLTVFALFVLFWFSIYQLYIGRNNPFLYFKF